MNFFSISSIKLSVLEKYLFCCCIMVDALEKFAEVSVGESHTAVDAVEEFFF